MNKWWENVLDRLTMIVIVYKCKDFGRFKEELRGYCGWSGMS